LKRRPRPNKRAVIPNKEKNEKEANKRGFFFKKAGNLSL
jgi:hypothetical protein